MLPNSICEDYVSEKLLDTLQASTVPIYLGSPNGLRERRRQRERSRQTAALSHSRACCTTRPFAHVQQGGPLDARAGQARRSACVPCVPCSLPICCVRPAGHNYDPGIVHGVHPAFIHIVDFESAAALAAHIRMLMADDEAGMPPCTCARTCAHARACAFARLVAPVDRPADSPA